MDQNIELKKEASIAVIKINRPEAANALSQPLLKELQTTMHIIEQDHTVRCAIITGNGGKAFCAGADLKERANMNDQEVIAAVASISETINRIEELSIPVIAAMNGVAFGGGLELALACDIRIAADHVQMGLTETSLAIIPGAGGTQRLPRLIGMGQAKRLIFGAKRIDAEEAYRIGLIEEIVSESDLMTEANKLATTISRNGPVALRQAKTAINKGAETDLKTGLLIERLAYQQTIPTKDRMEGLHAFREKRLPKYEGN